MSGVMVQLPVELHNHLMAMAQERAQAAMNLVQAIERNRVVIEPPPRPEAGLAAEPDAETSS